MDFFSTRVHDTIGTRGCNSITRRSAASWRQRRTAERNSTGEPRVHKRKKQSPSHVAPSDRFANLCHALTHTHHTPQWHARRLTTDGAWHTYGLFSGVSHAGRCDLSRPIDSIPPLYSRTVTIIHALGCVRDNLLTPTIAPLSVVSSLAARAIPPIRLAIHYADSTLSLPHTHSSEPIPPSSCHPPMVAYRGTPAYLHGSG